MSHLAGKFAGILQVAIDPERQGALTQALHALSGRGLTIVVESTRNVAKTTSQAFNFSVVGPERSGIVHERSVPTTLKLNACTIGTDDAAIIYLAGGFDRSGIVHEIAWA